MRGVVDMTNNDSLILGFDDEKDNSLSITLEAIDEIPDGILIFLNGYIDTYNSNFFQKKISKIVESGFCNLIFNCSSLNYVSSTGIGSFTSFLKTVKPKNGDIVLFEIQPKVFEVFQLLGFSQFFNIKETLEEAVEYFKNSGMYDVDVFPKIFSCPVCGKHLRATRAGRFRCSECKSILAIDGSGRIALG